MDKRSLIFVDQRVFRVWIKEVPSPDRKHRYIQNRKDNGLSIVGWDKWKDTRLFQEMDCRKRTLKTISVVFYNDKGISLYSDTNDNRQSQPIVPGSLTEELLDTICGK